jgi:hypothetical protein
MGMRNDLRTPSPDACFQVSNLLNFTNDHSLKLLAQQSKDETKTMKDLAERGFRDAVAVKVLTIVTLVYLPTTVVSVGLTLGNKL